MGSYGGCHGLFKVTLSAISWQAAPKWKKAGDINKKAIGGTK